MIKKIYFEKKFSIERNMHRYAGIWAVDSILAKGLTYGVADGKFAIIRCDGALYCTLDDIKKMASMLKPEIRDEVLAVYRAWQNR